MTLKENVGELAFLYSCETERNRKERLLGRSDLLVTSTWKGGGKGVEENSHQSTKGNIVP